MVAAPLQRGNSEQAQRPIGADPCCALATCGALDIAAGPEARHFPGRNGLKPGASSLVVGLRSRSGQGAIEAARTLSFWQELTTVFQVDDETLWRASRDPEPLLYIRSST
jgi:hypothetical protein